MVANILFVPVTRGVFAVECLKKFISSIKVEDVFDCMGNTGDCALEFSTIFFRESFSGASKRIFLNALTSSGASCASFCSLMRRS